MAPKKKWGKIGAPKSAKRRRWLASIRPKGYVQIRRRNPRRRPVRRRARRRTRR